MKKFDRGHFKPYLSKRNIIFISVLLIPIIYTLILFIIDDSEQYQRLGSANYQENASPLHCESGTKSGALGKTFGEESRDGIKYNVRTPSNYNPTIGHPLLMVYSPAKANRAGNEALTGLTYKATKAGFIVAYADHPELSPTSTIELGTIPSLIAKKWCIDQQRIYLTGHSDGGTSAMALAFMNGTKHIPKAIAPSAAGINYQDLRNVSCPDPLPVLIMHSINDHLFPGYGSESSGWWAYCNKCGTIPEKMKNGCFAYTNCANGVKTWYCEGNKLHAQWPEINSIMLDFFKSSN
ncbi:MAG: poly(3-hydroxybutyrate) depolymerase [Gammaproteobacteria bacterium]|jgi:polyhydroxybutyrate depolymerase|nr:poly(3-hydroxybutyrate) depolymerase [Gammaproteobacteria bacterium]MBT6419455.1 poly(3-hydroxybutyrate) depolymerase [Gammaproteobacteria bacterium]MBT6576458.1 poly(3-hydroxybutyrate) depolymerase [Gammaproteobacteria bacterium]MBT7436597.1 poly(3-hydroxybutyrate) depolymerase [Gammaproteobacteria bacterium]